MTRQTVPLPAVTEQLRVLGVERGGVLLVHTSFSKVAPIEDGPLGLIAALRDAVGPDGTLVMPSMSDDDDQPFDPRRTRCIGMGVVAESFWKLPAVLRSDSPHAFAAIGPRAAHITADHPLEVVAALRGGRVAVEDVPAANEQAHGGLSAPPSNTCRALTRYQRRHAASSVAPI